MATGKPPGSTPARAVLRKASASTEKPARPRARRAQQAEAQEPAVTRVQGKARTVIYIHGIGNKPPADVLRCQCDKALFGRPMGERTRLAHWVNRERYPVAEPGNCDARDVGPALNQSVQRALSTLGLVPGEQDLHLLADALAQSEQERVDLHQLLDELEDASAPGSLQAMGAIDAINRVLLRLISAALLQDVHDLFFVSERAALMRERLAQRLRAGGGPFVVVAHSRLDDRLRCAAPAGGRRLRGQPVRHPGSPLGLPQVRSMFKRWTGTRKLSFPECVQRWINVAETRDPIALDPDLTGDIANAKGRFENLAAARLNPDWQQNLHSASGYLSIPQVRAAVRQAVGVGFDQPVSNAVLIKDLSEQLEAHGPEHRHDVLIELDRRVLGNDPAGVRALLLQHVREAGARTTGLSGEALDEAIELEDSLQRFVSARLTRFEIESLQEHYRAFGFRRVWRDAGKRALIHESGNVLHADAAHTAYRARGQQIGWAVLDTGIAASHPHFFVKGERDNVVAQWDCTRRGAPKPLTVPTASRLPGSISMGMARTLPPSLPVYAVRSLPLSTRGVGGGSAGCGAERPHNNGAATISGDRS